MCQFYLEEWLSEEKLPFINLVFNIKINLFINRYNLKINNNFI